MLPPPAASNGPSPPNPHHAGRRRPTSPAGQAKRRAAIQPYADYMHNVIKRNAPKGHA